MNILAIDPGPEKSASLYLRDGIPTSFDIEDNESLLHSLGCVAIPHASPILVIEWVACYGRPVGQDVFLTARWAGRFEQASGLEARYLTRNEIKMALCHQTKGVNDAVIRQRLIDIYGGKETAIGNKKKPGPLYGIKSVPILSSILCTISSCDLISNLGFRLSFQSTRKPSLPRERPIDGT